MLINKKELEKKVSETEHCKAKIIWTSKLRKIAYPTGLKGIAREAIVKANGFRDKAFTYTETYEKNGNSFWMFR